MKRLLGVLAVVLVAFAAVLLVRTARYTTRQVRAEPVVRVAIDSLAAAQRLGAAIRFRTISHVDTARFEREAFRDLEDHLAATYPLLHASLAREDVDGYGAIFTWPGTDPSLAPVILMGHLDVVPVEPGTEAAWEYPPFSGAVAEGHIWGRGALDDKGSAIATMEAIEILLTEGLRPRRAIVLTLGYDEEVGGSRGAATIARRLRERGVRAEFVLDEGGVIVEGGLPIGAPAALIGIAEKGYLSLALSTRAEGGHSSMPPRETAIGILARAVLRLEGNPFPGSIRGPVEEMFAYVGPEMPFGQRLAFANLWLFRPLIVRQLSATPATDAMLRTTTAPTMFEGSVKDNVLPISGQAVVNFRIYPGETIESVTERVRRVVSDERVTISPFGSFAGNPSPVSPTDAAAFEALQRSIRSIFPDVVVAPYLVSGGTDSRYFYEVSDNVYRFSPFRVHQDDLPRIHGTNERLGIGTYTDGIRFFRQLILDTAS